MIIIQRLTIILMTTTICRCIVPEYYLDTEEQTIGYNNDTDTVNDEDFEEVSDKEGNKYNNDSLRRRVPNHLAHTLKSLSTWDMQEQVKSTTKQIAQKPSKSPANLLMSYVSLDADQFSPDFPHYYNQSSSNSQNLLEIFNRSDIYDGENLTDINIEDFALDDDKGNDSNAIRYLADFFNLQPAISKLDVKDISRKYNGTDYVWYVPEKYPCWDLPVVVGRLGPRPAANEVFRVNYGELVDVKPVGEREPPPPNKYLPPDYAKETNKWCSAAPCFGDHSLCVFADKRLSKICDDGYKVLRPSKLEKIGIVNTINSMRNSVASGVVDMYSHLPPAADMQQMLYDNDLEDMAVAWLRQCLPGIDPCSSLDDDFVTQLECTKCAENCCYKFYGSVEDAECIPMYECFIFPVVGCLYAWFSTAGDKITPTDVQCGHANPETFNTVQLIWAETTQIGCAYGERFNGDIRVVCNFAPGAPFFIYSKYFCGLVTHKDITNTFELSNDTDVTNIQFLASLGVILNKVQNINDNETAPGNATDDEDELMDSRVLRTSELDHLNDIYKSGWVRESVKYFRNGTIGLVARLVTRYTFTEEGMSRCDLDEPIYRVGEPGSMCIETGRRYQNLCYDFGDYIGGYRLAAILAPIALFSLILYDLFSGVMRQTNY